MALTLNAEYGYKIEAILKDDVTYKISEAREVTDHYGKHMVARVVRPSSEILNGLVLLSVWNSPLFGDIRMKVLSLADNSTEHYAHYACA